jgi:hypothetical protein
VTDFAQLLAALVNNQVAFVVIGGVALVSHGHVRFTADLDICYERSPENLTRIVQALAPLHPRLRGAPPELPFFFDDRTLKNGLNFTFVTDAGEIDLLGEVSGMGVYSTFLEGRVEREIFGLKIFVIGLGDLEKAKVAAGRPKDLLDLEAIRAIKNQG